MDNSWSIALWNGRSRWLTWMPVQYAQLETVIVNCFSLGSTLHLIGNLTSSAKYYKFFMYSSLSPVERFIQRRRTTAGGFGWCEQVTELETKSTLALITVPFARINDAFRRVVRSKLFMSPADTKSQFSWCCTTAQRTTRAYPSLESGY